MSNMLRSSSARRKLVFGFQGIFKVGSQTRKLRSPSSQGIGFVARDHIPHRQCESVQVVLNPQQLERIAPIAIHEFSLYLPEICNLASYIPGIGNNRAEYDHQSKQKSAGWSRAQPVLSPHKVRIQQHPSQL